MQHDDALMQVQDIGREDNYNYELQYSRFLDKEVILKDGDMLSAVCMYNSMDRDKPTRGGLASAEEMCVNFLLVYPSECCMRPFSSPRKFCWHIDVAQSPSVISACIVSLLVACNHFLERPVGPNDAAHYHRQQAPSARNVQPG
jgi:hypothetical protein